MKKTRLSQAIGKQLGRLLFTMLVLTMCWTNHVEETQAEYKKVAESELPLSTMHVYKNMDTSFLESFPYGSTYEGSVLVELETAQQMIEAADVRLKEGRVVQTAGFYEVGDLGGATYLLSEEKATGGIQLANGLYANLIMDTKVIDGKKWGIVNPKQLGAKGDGQEAEHEKINDAVLLAADFANKDDSVFRSIVYLPAGEYKCTDQVQLNVSNVNFVGEGNKSVIFTDNDYRKGIGYYEFFFTIWGAKDLYMADFLVEAREVNGYNYMRQMVFVDCDNVYTYQVNLNIPQESFSKDYYVDKQYSSLTYYSGNKNMTLDSCKLELMCSTYRGANLGILDFYSRGEENITIMNCELHSDARDEQVGIFSSRQNKDASFIRNVYFVNNTMYSYQPLDTVAAGGWRNMCFTVAYDDSKNISGVYIKGNHFIADLDSKLMTFGNGIESCVVENNMIDIRCTNNLGAYLFDSSVYTADRVLIQNNEIYLTYRDTENIGKAAILGGKATVKGNKIVSDTWLGNLGYLDGIYDGNTYINLGYLGSLANNLEEVTNNKVLSYGNLESVMYYNGDSEDSVVNFTGNYIVDYKRAYEANNVWNHVAKIQGGFKELNFNNNTYLAPNKYYWGWNSETLSNGASFIKGLFFYGPTIEKVTAKNNVLQGAELYYAYGCTVNEITAQAASENPEETLSAVRAALTVEEILASASVSGNVVSENEANENTIDEVQSETVSENTTDVVEETLDQAGAGVVNLEASNNVSTDYTLDIGGTVCTSVQITRNGVAQTEIFTDQDSVSLGTIVKAGHMNDDGECTDESIVTDKEIVWYTSLEGIGMVNEGVVTRKNYGEVAVFAVPTDGAQKNDKKAVFGKCNVHFVKGFATGITFEKDDITLQTTKKYKAVYEVAPVDKASQKVQWTSQNTDVATVSSIGVIEAVGVGETDILCSTLDGTGITKKIHVKVEPLTVKKITLSNTDWYDYEYEQNNNWANKGVEVGDTIQLEVSWYTPSDATNKGIKKWVSTNEAVATVDDNGFVTAVGGGNCEIRAYSMDETCYGVCGVWVQPEQIAIEDVTVYHTEKNIKLTWEPQENIHGYIIYCDIGDGNGYQERATISDPESANYEAISKTIGGFVEAGNTYKFKIATYIKRWDSNSFSHVYETLSDEISVTTYSNPVISSFNTLGVDSVGVTVGGTANIGVYCSKNTMASSFKSDNEEIFTVKDLTPTQDNYNLQITGVKQGLAYLVLKGEDELGYERKIPVFVYDFQKTGSNIQAEPLIKSVQVKWKVEGKDNQDGFIVTYKYGALKYEISLSMDELSLETDENGDLYATYTIGGLSSDADYTVWVKPYKTVENVTFTGPDSKQLSVHTPVYVNVESITTDDLYLLNVAENKKITAEVGPEDASEPNLVWIPGQKSVIQVTESGTEDSTTRYAMIKGVKAGISSLSVVANDENNYQIQLKVVVLPEKTTDVSATADVSNINLKWNACADAEGYAVYRFDETQNQWTNIASIEETAYVDSGLTADTEYIYKIGAYITDGDTIYEGDCSDEVAIHTLKDDGSGDDGNGGNGSDNGSGDDGNGGNGSDDGSGNNGNGGSSSHNGSVVSGNSTNSSEDKETGASDNGGNTVTEDDAAYYEVAFQDRKIRDFKISKNYMKKVKLSWKTDKEADGYEIYQYKSSKWKKVATITNGKTTARTIKKLKAGTSYKFRIRGYKMENGNTVYTKYTNLKVMTKPSKVKVTSVSAGSKKVTLKWKKVKSSGYEIQYCTSKKFKKNVTKINVKKSKKTATVKKLKAGNTYYVRIRAYSKVNGVKYYGAWSKVKKVQVK